MLLFLPHSNPVFGYHNQNRGGVVEEKVVTDEEVSGAVGVKSHYVLFIYPSNNELVQQPKMTILQS